MNAIFFGQDKSLLRRLEGMLDRACFIVQWNDYVGDSIFLNPRFAGGEVQVGVRDNV